jgi:hypothetical protein
MKDSKSSSAPTTFVVRSREQKGRKPLVAIVAMLIIGGCSYSMDRNIQNGVVWFVGGICIALVVLATSPFKREVELAVVISPLGVQRTSSINGNETYHPLLPRDSVQDCVLTEHVGAFSVSTQLVFRVKSSSLVPVFPNAQLSFSQCHSFVQQIQRALNET